MKIISYFFIATLVFVTACNDADKKTTPVAAAPDTTAAVIPAKNDTVAHGEFHVDTVYTAKQNKILDIIKALPEFKQSSKYIDSLTAHKRGLSMMIFKPEPAKGEKDYYVQVGFNGTDRFETYYNFYVDSSTLAIKIADVMEGDIVPMKTWRDREAKRK